MSDKEIQMSETAGWFAEWGARGRDHGYSLRGEERCPRVLVRQECRGVPDCWCNSRLNDHGRHWTRADGTAVVLWEPYSAHPEELAVIFYDAAADGLRVAVHGGSPWNPGRTVAIEFSPDPDAAAGRARFVEEWPGHKAQIDAENGEAAKYNQSITLYNAAAKLFGDWYNRTHMPIAAARALLPSRRSRLRSASRFRSARRCCKRQ